MSVWIFIGILIFSYLIGSIPFGFVLVYVFKGIDIRKIQSGRTGGTNAMRAAGFWVGLATALLDVFKGAVGVWIAAALLPGNLWLQITAPLMAILGHNYSIFLAERDENGKIRLRGGAGGAPCVGGSVGLWGWSFFIIVPVGFFILFGIGYASITTLSIALMSTVIFTVLAALQLKPWLFVLYGVLAELLLIWALRPNIRRLLDGTERKVGWNSIFKRSQQESNP